VNRLWPPPLEAAAASAGSASAGRSDPAAALGTDPDGARVNLDSLPPGDTATTGSGSGATTGGAAFEGGWVRATGGGAAPP
jgi:hypothetical protein